MLCATQIGCLFAALLTFGAYIHAAPATGWSGASAISPDVVPDPTRGSQLNDVAVNASGVTVAAWDQFGSYDKSTGTYNWTATIGAAVQSGGRWSVPFTISGNTAGYATTPKVAVGADGTMAVS